MDPLAAAFLSTTNTVQGALLPEVLLAIENRRRRFGALAASSSVARVSGRSCSSSGCDCNSRNSDCGRVARFYGLLLIIVNDVPRCFRLLYSLLLANRKQLSSEPESQVHYHRFLSERGDLHLETGLNPTAFQRRRIHSIRLLQFHIQIPYKLF